MKSFHIALLLSAGITGAALLSPVMACAQSQPAQGITRAEVRAQLIAAEKDGLLPDSQTDYPPSAYTIEVNRMAYRAAHPCERPVTP